MTILDGVRRRIEAAPVWHDDHAVGVTASFGGTCVIPGEAEDEILARAGG